ncbi:MAG: Na+/H+ antiporter [Actinobacteria bacterium]|nr:Na+/H+ antiporter [Actinomycetota bacterium]
MLARVAFVLVTVAVIVLAKLVAERIRVPFTILLTIAGLVYAVLPGPNLHLDPDVVLVLVLPPLLYSASLHSSLLAIRANLRPIVSLSVALVLLTALSVGGLLTLVVPALPFAAGAVLGAAVAPPDPVAALSVGRRAGLSPRLTTLIEGEGLLNDATALTLYQVAVAAAVGGGFSFVTASGRFVLSAVGGLLVGVVVALVVRVSRRWLSEPIVANAISLGVPFLAYLFGEEIHVSGVLAVVVAGLMIGHDAPRVASSASRLQTGAVWQLVDFLLEGFVFLLIGQQLKEVLRGLKGESIASICAAAGVTVGVVLVLRPVWLYVSQLVPSKLHARLGGGDGARRLGAAEIVALSWAGTRGVISLAAIFAVPLTTKAGDPFPGRDLLLFCTYLVVLVTLVGQGLTFGPLIRRLGLRVNAAEEAQLRNEARAAAVQAALTRLADLRAEDPQLPPRVAETLRETLDARAQRFAARIATLQESDDGQVHTSPAYAATVRARRAIIDAQHEELLRWRDSGRLPDASLRTLQRELDHEERTLPDV